MKKASKKNIRLMEKSIRHNLIIGNGAQFMANMAVITIPHPTLRKKAHPIAEVDSEIQTLIDEMVESMREDKGVGLAAPQVNVSRRVITVEYGSEEDPSIPPTLYVIINPEITNTSTETVLGVEGCLSIPGLVGEVERSTSVTVEGLNRRGEPIKMKASGWLARIFQHEIDHLDGVLFTDKALEVWEPEDDHVDRV
jgi:peptide deformylase